LFLDHEESDLITFLQISICFGWDAILLGSGDYARIRLSHDEWIEFFMKDEAELERIIAIMKEAGLGGPSR
jgi:hypothetical protein